MVIGVVANRMSNADIIPCCFIKLILIEEILVKALALPILFSKSSSASFALSSSLTSIENGVNS